MIWLELRYNLQGLRLCVAGIEVYDRDRDIG